MSIENAIKDVITEKLNDGTIEKIVGEKFEESIKAAVKGLFEWNGTCKKLVEEKIEEAMIPVIQKHDFSKYVTKLDAVMVDVIKAVAEDNNKLLDNFKDLMNTTEVPKQIKASDLFDEWIKYVEENVDTDGLKVEFDDRPYYEYVEVVAEASELEQPSWSSYSRAAIHFSCKHDESMNQEIHLKKWREDGWEIERNTMADIQSLRYISGFELYLIKLAQAGTKIDLDITYEREDVLPNKEPEASFS